MSDPASPQFEVHDREVLDRAKSILGATESPRAWAQTVIEAVESAIFGEYQNKTDCLKSKGQV